MNIVSERNITLAEVKNILKDKKREYTDEEKELFYEQKRAFDHAGKAAKLGLKDANKLIEEIRSIGLSLSEDQMIKIADLLPETVDDVRAIFAKERFKYGEEEIKKVLDVVAKYR
jgi:DNA-directed RNA polymerase subunit F